MQEPIYFRFDYKGVKDVPLEILMIFGIAQDQDEFENVKQKEEAEPLFGSKLDNVVIYKSRTEFFTDAIMRGGMFKHMFDMSVSVRYPYLWDILKPEKKVAISNYFNLPPKVPIASSPEPEARPPEPEFTKIEKPKVETHLIKEKPTGFDEFKRILNEHGISVLLIDTKEEADRKRIRFLALGFKVMFFPYKDKFIVLISINEFEKDILTTIQDAMSEYLSTKVDVEIGLPEITGKPKEPFRPSSPELALQAIKQTMMYPREILKEEIQNVMVLYPILWDNFLNLCVEYDEEHKEYYRLRKDFSRTIRGICIFTRGLTKLVKKEGNTSYYESKSEDPKSDKIYHITITTKGGWYILDSDEPDRINEVTVDITVDGKRIVERFITKHMVSSLIIETYGEEIHVA